MHSPNSEVAQTACPPLALRVIIWNGGIGSWAGTLMEMYGARSPWSLTKKRQVVAA